MSVPKPVCNSPNWNASTHNRNTSGHLPFQSVNHQSDQIAKMGFIVDVVGLTLAAVMADADGLPYF